MNRIYLCNYQRRFRLPTAGYRRLLLTVMDILDLHHADMTVVYCNRRRIRELNATYRGLDSPTDVLSFPDGSPGDEGRTYLGEIFISAEMARENATAYDVDMAAEMAQLHIHGLLHLLGHDHEVDDGAMLALQDRLMERIRPQIPAIPPSG